MRIFTVGFALALSAFLWLSPNLAAALMATLGLCVFALKATRPFGMVFLCGLMLGGLLAHVSSTRELNRQFFPGEWGNEFQIVGSVISVPKHEERRSSFLFQIEKFVHAELANQPKKIRLSWYGWRGHSVRAGDRWQFTVRLKPPASLGNPGGFNFERWLFQNHIHATGYVRDKPAAQRLGKERFSLHAIRQSIADKISALSAANAYAPLVQGLTVGVTNGIDKEHWQTLRQSGTAHLLAISGLHIGLIGAWFYVLAGWIWHLIVCCGGRVHQRLWPKPIFTLCVSFFAACVYAALAGFSLPTQRALIMLAVFAFAVVLRRVWPPGSALIIALLMVLLLDPLVVLSVGFWLSFGTVFALFYLHSGRVHHIGKKTAALFLHLKLGIVLLPVSAWFFQHGSLIAPLANAVAVPIVALIVVPLAFIVAILAPLWPSLANGLLLFNQWILSGLLRFLNGLLSMPGANLPLFMPGPMVFFCVLLGLLMFFSPRSLRIRWLALPLLIPGLLINVFGTTVRGFELHVLDVGQGLSAVVLTENHTVLFDTGRRLSKTSTMFDRVVQPFLVSKGRAHIDVAVISHADDDHSGGLQSLLAQHKKVKVFASDKQNLSLPGLSDDNQTRCQAGQSFSFDHVHFAFVHPHPSDIGSKNNLSCVLLVHYGRSRVLLTGDIESESEQLLVNRMQQRFPVSVLVAPHHGSRSSSTPDFVSAFQPEVVIFPAGERNAFGFPHKEVVDRYRQAGAAIYLTGEGGAVQIKFDQQGIATPIVQFWNNRRRYRR